MAKKKTYGRRESGGAAMKRLGRHPVLLGLSAEDLDLIDRARKMAPRAKYILHAARELAKKDLENSDPQSKNSA